jgi:hypothetical protein
MPGHKNIPVCIDIAVMQRATLVTGLANLFYLYSSAVAASPPFFTGAVSLRPS